MNLEPRIDIVDTSINKISEGTDIDNFYVKNYACYDTYIKIAIIMVTIIII